MLSKKEFTERLARRVKQVRVEKGISQEELAYQAGLYRTYVGHIENARYSPSSYVLYRIAKALKVELKNLLSV
jgi:transcriptional regulator with XRE-family HTH domain